MYIAIGGKDYAKLKALTFQPSADLMGQSVPIDGFTADIITDDAVDIGQTAELYDDLERLWARYWIVSADRLTPETLRVKAESFITLLDRQTLNAVMYEAEPVADVLVDCFANTGAAVGVYEYALDPALAGATVTGFCPEQTARARLLWVVFSIGACVRSCFSDKILIQPIDDTETLIPAGQVYWRPQVSYSDYVTAVRAKYYSFAEGTPQTTDQWVKDGNGVTYIVTEQEMSLSNPDAPAAAPENTVSVEGVYLLNSGNVTALLSRLARLYFKRTRVELDAIDNAEYVPGDRVIARTGSDALMSGYIESADFAFGTQSKARLKLIAAETVASAGLTVAYLHEGDQLDRKEFLFPVGYVYTLPNPYFDQTWNTHRYIFRPTTEAVTGTLPAGGKSETVQYTEALDLNLQNLNLEIISVDALTASEGIVEIA